MAHHRALTVSRDHFPVLSKVPVGLYAMISICKRVLCTIMYFTPPLGLFSLLRHLQAEQTKFDDSFEKGDALDKDGYIYFGNSPPIAWNTIERWNRTSDEAPDYTFYSLYRYTLRSLRDIA